MTFPTAPAERIKLIQKLSGIDDQDGGIQDSTIRLLCAQHPTVSSHWRHNDLFHAFEFLQELLVNLDAIYTAHCDEEPIEDLQNHQDDLHKTLGAMVKHFSLAVDAYSDKSIVHVVG